MSDQPENMMLILLRRLGASMARLRDDMADMRLRMTTMETQIGNFIETESSHYASLATRLDKTDERLSIERRLDLVDHGP